MEVILDDVVPVCFLINNVLFLTVLYTRLYRACVFGFHLILLRVSAVHISHHQVRQLYAKMWIACKERPLPFYCFFCQ